MDIMKSNHAVHQIGYHIVFCTKFRHRILTGTIEVETKRIIGQICKTYNWKLKSLEVMPDHIHIFTQVDHTIAPVRIAQILKSITAVYLFTKFPNLKGQKFWGTGLWSPSTYYGTVGYISEETIKKYIENQKSKPDSSMETSSIVSSGGNL